MLKNISEINGSKSLTKKAQQKVNGGCPPPYPRTEEECNNCGGEWSPLPFGPGGLCALSVNSPCA